MAFVLVACKEDNRARARVLAAKLVANGIDVCSDLERAPTDVRAGAYRAAIDHGALMVALWSQDDHTDAAYVDHMLYAQRSGRLFAVAIGGARLPGILGGEDGATSAFDDGDAQRLDSIADLVAQRVSELDAQGDLDERAPGSVAEETKAFLRLQSRKDANALARFLREYPEGMFEQVVRDQLDAETRPHYQPDQPVAGGGWFGALGQKLRFDGAHSGGGEDEPLAKDVWRMEASPLSAAREMGASVARHARSPAGLVIAGVMLVGILGFVGLKWIHWPQARPLATTVTIAPRNAYADSQARDVTAGPLPPSASTPAPAGDAARPANGSLDALRGPPPEVPENPPPPAEQGAPPPFQTPAIEIQPSITNAPTAGDAAARQAQAESDARAIQLARRQDTVAGYNAYLAAFPAGAFAGEARSARDRLMQGPAAFDLSQLEPGVRGLVQRARADEASANAAAARSGGAIIITRPGAGAGNYRGASSGGVAIGVGKAVWGNGDVYAGSWNGSLPNGFGVLRLANGSRYEGEFAGGSPTGRGVFWNEEGRRLMGDRLFAALVSARSQ